MRDYHIETNLTLLSPYTSKPLAQQASTALEESLNRDTVPYTAVLGRCLFS
jgi:hypothetical protein